jgi:hypothetical protein
MFLIKKYENIIKKIPCLKVPRMKEVFKKKDGKREKLPIFLTICGFWVGTVFMLLLSIFEEDISLNISSCSA